MPVNRILHRAGNVREFLRFADHPAVDALEADVWVRGDELVAHHERPLGPLPLLVGKWRIRRLGDPVRLSDLVEPLRGRAGIVLDLRSWFGDPAPNLASQLLAIEHHEHVTVTCEAWAIADRVRSWAPDVVVGYSVRSEQQLALYEREVREGTRPRTAVAIRHTLLRSREELAVLQRLAGHVTAWTVDDIDRALELLTWGVDGIVSNRITVLNSL